LKLVGFLGLLHRERAATAEDIGHEASVTRIEMLHDDDRGRKVRRQRRQDLAQRLEAARRGGHRDHFECCAF